MEILPARDVLQCSICFEISASPIHTCTNGHIVCGMCIDKIKKCPQCKGNLTVSSLAERTVRRNEFILPCLYSTQGCPKNIRSTELKDHVISSCSYRPLACILRGKNFCRLKSIQPEDLFSHLTLEHKLFTLSDSTSGNIESRKFYRTFDNKMPGIVGKLFDGKKFLACTQVKDDVVYDWVTIIGDKADADQYKIVVRSPDIPSKSAIPASEYAKFTWELPVVPIHDSALCKVKERGHAATIHWTALVPFCEEKEDEDKIMYKYTWSYKIEILKV